jgi:SAM-dependent methyltransferase
MPFKRFFDPRFRQVQDHLEVSVNQRVDTVEDLVREMDRHLDELAARFTADTQTMAEFATTFRRSTDKLHAELHDMWGWVAAGDSELADLLLRSSRGDVLADAELGKLFRDRAPGASDRVAGALEGVTLPIGPGLADLLNWAAGHTGPAAQAGVWFNPPVTLFHHDGTVRAGEVNERIVELPWALGAAMALAPGALVLDFGATESTLSLSLASIGLDVIAADLRPYPLSHPRLRSLVGPIERWDGPERPLDAVFCVSAIEHVGLGAYDEAPTEGTLDHTIVRRFKEWLRPGGELVLTAPYGHWSVDELQRVYDAEHLDALLAGWRVTQRAVCLQTAPDRWERLDGEPDASTWDDGRRGVVLVRATPA